MIERAAVDADADGLAVVDRDLADGGELFVAALARANIARVDAVFVKLPGAFPVFRQQDVAVVVKIADDGRAATDVEQALLDFRNGRCSFGDVHGPTHNFGTGLGQFYGLLERGFDVGGVRVGH